MDRRLIPFVVLWLASSSAMAQANTEFETRVVRVVSGDTVIVERDGGEVELRIADIGAPQGSQFLAPSSRTAVDGMVRNRAVRVQVTGVEEGVRTLRTPVRRPARRGPCPGATRQCLGVLGLRARLRTDAGRERSEAPPTRRVAQHDGRHQPQRMPATSAGAATGRAESSGQAQLKSGGNAPLQRLASVPRAGRMRLAGSTPDF